MNDEHRKIDAVTYEVWLQGPAGKTLVAASDARVTLAQIQSLNFPGANAGRRENSRRATTSWS